MPRSRAKRFMPTFLSVLNCRNLSPSSATGSVYCRLRGIVNPLRVLEVDLLPLLKLFPSQGIYNRAKLSQTPPGGKTMNALGKGIMIASAVASLITSGSLVARATDKAGSETVRFSRINECKREGSCVAAEHSFAGQYSCQ